MHHDEQLRTAVEDAHLATKKALDLAYQHPRARLRTRLRLGRAQSILIGLLVRWRG